jgi:hypothetical protein
LYASYKDQIEFLIVYVREAHPEMLKEGNSTGIVGRPENLNERTILATKCVTEFEFTIPTVIDGMQGTVNDDYKSAPVRVTITDLDGKVAYYAGPGPRDFRLSAVERVLKRLVANAGYVPPPPEPQWGQPMNGLRCGLRLDPPDPRIGEDVVARVLFNNTTEKSIGLYLKSEQLIEQLVIEDDSGNSLVIVPAGSETSTSKRPARRSGRGKKRRRRQVHEIEPGQSLFCDIYGNIETASDLAAAGSYNSQFSVTVDPNTVAEFEEEGEGEEEGEEGEEEEKQDFDFPLWTGQLSSGTCTINAGPALPESCADCHGKKDYHHIKSYGCQNCHIGEVGNDDFDTKKEVCSQCHPRKDKRGRRQILGRDGEFNLTSRHISGRIDDKDCLKCHDHSGHRNGTVSLIDPTLDGDRPWTGTNRDFCLTCHVKQPPEGVSFPTDRNGSGYDKSSFTDTTHAKWLGEHSCSHCHYSHGSPNRSLLRERFVTEADETTDSIDSDYALCWMCHDKNRVLTEANSFDNFHGMHVEHKGIMCYTCHDVHSPYDSGQAGLIRFRSNAQTDNAFHFLDDRNAETSFVIDDSRNEGSCYVSCHEDNEPKQYRRDNKTHTVSCLHCH